MSECTLCRGVGFTMTGEGSPVACRCSIRKSLAIRVRMTPGLEDAKMGKGCVEFKDGRAIPLAGSAIIRCSWLDMPDHVAGWLYASRAAPKVILTSTADLRAAYLAGTLPDAVKGPDLVVVNLLDNENPILAKVVIETIALAKSIWLVHSLGNTLGKGHSCWSPAVGEMVAGFSRRDLGPADNPAASPSAKPANRAESVRAKLGIKRGAK